MLINFNHLQTFYSALKQKLKSYRGNWEQNNPEADDYIKNRPFYSEVGESVVLPETDVIIIDGNPNYINYAPIIPFIEGQAYGITWNGINYNCTARLMEGLAAVGNEVFLGGNNSGEPFLIAIDEGAFGGAFVVSEDGTHTVSISTYGEIVHQIDKKYVPIPNDIITSNEFYDELDNLYGSLYNDINAISNSAVRTVSQSLTSAQKQIARINIGAANDSEVVKIVSQNLTDAQKQIARNNIGASNFSGSYNDLSDKPEQVQANWNEFDTSSVSYIKNKPFSHEYEFTEPTSESFIQTLCSGELDSGGVLYKNEFDYNGTPFQGFDANDGNNLYCFVINGKQIFSECHMFKNSYAATQQYIGIGNAYLTQQIDSSIIKFDVVYEKYQWTPVQDTGENWFLVRRNNTWTFITTEPDMQVTAIYHILSESIKQLDEKYIPDTIARKSDIPTELPTVTTSDSGKFLRVSMDGIWAAETIHYAEEVEF